MREIKFRYYCKDTKEYEYIDQFLSMNELVLHNSGLYRVDEYSGYSGGGAEITDESERYIVEQYTGLKDKNGVEIYEGDLLHNPHDENYCYPVMWNDEHASFGLGELGDDESLKPYQIPVFWEVIGNIHQNKDLLNE